MPEFITGVLNQTIDDILEYNSKFTFSSFWYFLFDDEISYWISKYEKRKGSRFKILNKNYRKNLLQTYGTTFLIFYNGFF